MTLPSAHLLQVYRYSSSRKFGGSTVSFCRYNGELYMYGMEDEHREIKVSGETRIPAGTYKLGIKRTVTPKTESYRKRFSWFDKHIEIMGVENFTNVYIHVGNYEADTDACYLTGNNPSINTIEPGKVSASVDTFKRFYHQFYPMLQAGKDVYIEFIDMDNAA